jgi:hypothetical protein
VNTPKCERIYQCRTLRVHARQKSDQKQQGWGGRPGVNFTLSVCSCSVPYFLPSDMIINANRQQDGEIEALNKTISNLRDYVVDTGQYLTRDQPFL